jgi:hypothetical protein
VTAATAGRIPLAASIAVLLAAGACGPVMTGALTSRLASVVDAPALPRAFGLDALSYNVAGIAGPALAALVSGVAAPAVATFALAGAAALGALPLAGLPERRQGRRTQAPPPWHAGLRAVARDRVLGVVTVASSLGQLGPGALAVVAAGLAQRAHAAPAGGWLMTAVAGGGLLGSLVWTWRPATERRAPIIVMASLAGTGAALAAAAMTRSLPAAAGCFALSGVFAGPFSGALFTTRQAHAPERVRAQVFAIGAGLKTTAAAAGAAAAGALAGLPVATQLLLVASAPLVAACTGAAALATSAKQRPSQNVLALSVTRSRASCR